jgi:hypothetical protein
VTDDRLRTTRVPLVAGVLFGVAYLTFVAAVEPWRFGLNFRVYRVAAIAALAGENFYAVAPPGLPEYTYLYPPVTVPGVLPYALVPWPVGYTVHTLLTLGLGVVLAAVLVRVVERHGPSLSRLDRALVGGFVLFSVHSMPSLVFGQVNLWLALALALGFLWIEHGEERRAGGAFALAALPKAFPAAVGVWLLRRRAWTAVASAVATGTGLLLAGVAVFGIEAHRRYLFDALLPRRATDAFAGGLAPTAEYVTIRRPLSVLLPIDGLALAVAAALVLAPVLAILYRDLDSREDRLVAVFGTVAAVFLFFPSYPVYYVLLYYPLVPLLYLLDGPCRGLFVGGATLATLTLRIEHVELTLSGVARGAVDAVVAALTPAFTLATPQLCGVLLMVAGCVVHVHDSG